MAEQTRQEPVVVRPLMPKDYGVPEDKEGTIAWSDADRWLSEAKIYWIATTRPDGRPHAVPIWGAWVEERFYFDGSPETRWGRNIAENPAIVVHIEKGDVAVMVEGVVEEVKPGPEVHKKIREAYGARYDYVPTEGVGMYMVEPTVGFAWGEFPKSVTKYRFGEKE
ncbi:MAG: pyridoxamine 5'-phosphate oxidase family protein [Chloroflexota bacterium]